MKWSTGGTSQNGFDKDFFCHFWQTFKPLNNYLPIIQNINLNCKWTNCIFLRFYLYLFHISHFWRLHVREQKSILDLLRFLMDTVNVSWANKIKNEQPHLLTLTSIHTFCVFFMLKEICFIWIAKKQTISHSEERISLVSVAALTF
jgi:hypothetical protein